MQRALKGETRLRRLSRQHGQCTPMQGEIHSRHQRIEASTEDLSRVTRDCMKRYQSQLMRLRLYVTLCTLKVCCNPSEVVNSRLLRMGMKSDAVAVT
jgi:hypothetical protein